MPSKSILLVMDMINDLVHPDGVGAQTYVVKCRERGVYENTVLAIKRARAAGIMVGYVRVGFSPDYRECPPTSPVFSKAKTNNIFQLGAWGTEVYADFAPQEGDADIVKHRSAHSTARRYYRCCGRNGHQPAAFCVASRRTAWSPQRCAKGTTAIIACVVLEDCCAGATKEEHEFALVGLAPVRGGDYSSRFRSLNGELSRILGIANRIIDALFWNRAELVVNANAYRQKS